MERMIRFSWVAFTDRCILCKTCFKNCPMQAIESEEKDNVLILRINDRVCIQCEVCMEVCPVDKALIGINEIVRESVSNSISDEKVYCKRCGLPFTSRRMLEYIVDGFPNFLYLNDNIRQMSLIKNRILPEEEQDFVCPDCLAKEMYGEKDR